MSVEPSENALTVLRARYLRRDAGGQVVETPEELFRRVARSVAQAEAKYGGMPAEWEERFFQAMTALDLLPNSPCLMNAGTALGMLSACFVLPVEDSIDGIFDSLKLMALIQQAGGVVEFAGIRRRVCLACVPDALAGDYVIVHAGIAISRVDPVEAQRVFAYLNEIGDHDGWKEEAPS